MKRLRLRILLSATAGILTALALWLLLPLGPRAALPRHELM